MTGGDFDEYDYLERQVQSKGHSPQDKHDKHKSDRHASKKRSRSRSRSRSRRHRSRSRERRHRRSRSPRSHRRERERTPPDVRLAREQERELRELERATRTVFAYNLNIKADERDLFEFFSKAGKVTDIRLITDRNTKKSKGLAYIEFAKKEEVFTALQFTGSLFMGQPVMVKSAEAEKNMAWEAQQQAKQVQPVQPQPLTNEGPCKLQILNLHPELSESDLKPLFEPFGTIDSVQVVRDATGGSMKYAYVMFRSGVDAEKAMKHWNGKVVADLVLAVSVAPTGNAAVPALGELDEDDDNMKLSAQARAYLMNRLASSAGLQAPQPTTPPGYAGAPPSTQDPASNTLLLEQGLLGPASPIPTACLLLKNMFDPQEITDPEAEKEITQDVLEECSKFGKVLHCFVDKNSKGFVYLKFETLDAARSAAMALQGRWYSGHQIVADYQFLQVYNNHFKL